MRYQLDMALHRPGAVELLLFCALTSVALFWPLARLMRWRPAWTLPALLSLAPILVFTAPFGALGWQEGALPRLAQYVGSFLAKATFQAALDAPALHEERFANLLLFIPLGFFGALATRRPFWTLLGGAALSFGVEGWQAVSGVRDATAADWLYNSGGTLFGAAAGLVLLAAHRFVPPAPETTPSTETLPLRQPLPPTAAMPPAPHQTIPPVQPAPGSHQSPWQPAPAYRHPSGDTLLEPTLAFSMTRLEDQTTANLHLPHHTTAHR
ncbi:VanZ family protein [Actinoplanes sp. NPDC051859]|uniref:VanZ family protein n=1 Tax=Actinoplanes sp. NPDC051859 TaxID=3363909 RepID=UPI0037BBC456